MTNRAIAAIPMNGFDSGDTPRAAPIFEDVDPTTLLVHASYQRDSSERSPKLGSHDRFRLDGTKFKPPVAVTSEAALS